MKKINNIEKIINVYSWWKPSDIVFIKSMFWEENKFIVIFYCQLRNQKFGWPDQQDNFFEVSVNFENVSSLKIDFDYNSNGLQQVSGFDIIDVSNNGLEFINYQIEDYENDTIHFYCENIIILNVCSPVKLKFMT